VARELSLTEDALGTCLLAVSRLSVDLKSVREGIEELESKLADLRRLRDELIDRKNEEEGSLAALGGQKDTLLEQQSTVALVQQQVQLEQPEVLQLAKDTEAAVLQCTGKVGKSRSEMERQSELRMVLERKIESITSQQAKLLDSIEAGERGKS
jgi:chromosome segregation ATPase